MKKLAGQTAVYGLTTIGGRLLNYMLVPLYTALMAPDVYGLITEMYAYAAFFNVLLTAGLETTYFRWVSEHPEDEEALFNRFQSLAIQISSLTALVLLIISGSMVYYSHTPGYEPGMWALMIAICLIDAWTALPLARLRQKKKALNFSLARLSAIVLNVVLNLLFLFIIDNGRTPLMAVWWVLWANLLSNFVIVPLTQKAWHRWNFVLPDATERKRILGYAWPVMLAGLAGMVNEVLDRIILRFLLTDGNAWLAAQQLTVEEAMGIYGACYKLSIFMTLGIQAFRFAAEPFFFERHKQGDAHKALPQVMHSFVIVGAWVFLSVSLHLDWLSLLLRNPAYRVGLGVVPILLLANLFLGIYYNLSIWYKATNRTQVGLYITLIGAAITLVINLALVPWVGYMGCAIATLACYATMAALSYMWGSRAYPVPYRVWPALGYMALAICLFYLNSFIVLSGFWQGFAFHMFLSVVYLVVVGIIEWPRRKAV